MGKHARILSERPIEPALYSDWPLTVELRETFHLHYRNWRPVVNKEQFLLIADALTRARQEFDRLGQPDPDASQSLGLADVKLPPPLHQNRLALEHCVDDTIHFHFDDMRLHVDEKTFFRMGLVFREGLQEYCKHNATIIKLSEAVCPGRALEPYLSWLDEYLASEHREDPDDFADRLLEMKRCQRPEDEQRYSAGWLKHPDGTEYRTRLVPKEINKRYLCTMYESIKKYGYGQGPYKYDYIRAVRLGGKIQLTGAHRAACLIKLGYEEIPVVVTN